MALTPPRADDWARMWPLTPRYILPETTKTTKNKQHMIFEFTNTTDWLSSVGAGITQVTSIEPTTHKGEPFAKFEFSTSQGCGSGLYSMKNPMLAKICRACGFPARAGDRLDSAQLIGKRFWGVWGARIGNKDGYTYAELAVATSIPADAVDWRTLTPEEWTALGRGTDGIGLSARQKDPKIERVEEKEDEDFPF